MKIGSGGAEGWAGNGQVEPYEGERGGSVCATSMLAPKAGSPIVSLWKIASVSLLSVFAGLWVVFSGSWRWWDVHMDSQGADSRHWPAGH